MSTNEMRSRIVSEARSWIGTPYISNAMIKGPGGGTDCAMLLFAVYGSLGLIPGVADPRPYSPQWHIHRTEEKYMEAVLKYAKQIDGPPLPGDLVMFRIGQVHAHGAIVVGWPNVVHARGGAAVAEEDISKDVLGKRALARVPRLFFSLWEA